jgi:hypothetical protein
VTNREPHAPQSAEPRPALRRSEHAYRVVTQSRNVRAAPSTIRAAASAMQRAAQ